jgi:threonine aldolase
MDGARFANALAHLGVTPAEMSWKAGIDLLSFGGTKNGCLGAEALIVFDPEKAEDLPYLRKRAGQLFSKSRLIAAQFDAYLRDGLWLDLARHANSMADRLRSGLAQSGQAREAWPTQGNEVFAVLRRADAERLRRAGATFHDWTPPRGSGVALGPDERLVRFVASFATSEAEVERFLAELART